MAVQITKKVRPKGGPEPVASKKDYLAYFGQYRLDIENAVVHHELEGQLFPGDHPNDLKRKYHFFEDKLSLKPDDGTNREILWQRL
jgi:hypothetical protein